MHGTPFLGGRSGEPMKASSCSREGILISAFRLLRFLSRRFLPLALGALSCWIVARFVLARRGPKHVRTDKEVCNGEKLIEWMASKGVQAPKIALGEFAFEDPAGKADFWVDRIRYRRGMLALKDIRPGDILLAVPWEALITVEHLKNSTDSVMAALASDAEAALEQTDVLALFVLREFLNRDSEWAPYVCMLPRSFTNTIFWDREKLLALGDEELFNSTAAQQQQLVARYYKKVLPALRRHPGVLPRGHLTIDNYLWGYTVVASRNWGFTYKGQRLRVMVPFADLANHRNGEPSGATFKRPSDYVRKEAKDGVGHVLVTNNASVEGRGRGVDGADGYELLLVSGRHFRRGEEVMISYGDNCNRHFLLVYGFSIPGNQVPCSYTLPSGLQHSKERK